MGRESDYKITRVRDYPKKIVKAIERGDTELLAQKRMKFSALVKRILGSKRMALSNKLNEIVQLMDEALDMASTNKSKKI